METSLQNLMHFQTYCISEDLVPLALTPAYLRLYNARQCTSCSSVYNFDPRLHVPKDVNDDPMNELMKKM